MNMFAQILASVMCNNTFNVIVQVLKTVVVVVVP